MFWISQKYLWIPMYALILYFIIKKYKWKTITVLLSVVILITLISVFIKDFFERLRPCHNPSIESMVHLVNGYCGGSFGFISSHASNSFALAVFTGMLLKNNLRYYFPLIILWAIIVCYSRIYLGAHYPADIIGGALLGSILAFIMNKVLFITNNYFFKNDK